MGILSKIFGAKEKAPEVTEDIRPFTGILDHGGGVNDFYIAGLAHHCSRKDVGVHRSIVSRPVGMFSKQAQSAWHK